MRRILIFVVGVTLCLAARAQSGVIHGNGDPRTLTPQPNCANSRFYVDDSSGKLYEAASGSPCVWTDQSAPVYAGLPSAANVSTGASKLRCGGDSICAGNEDGTGITYFSQLAALGRPAASYGIGGQRSGPIAVRVNAYAGQTQQTFASGFTLPASGSVTCTFQSSYEPAYNLTAGGGNYPSGVPLSFQVGSTSYSVNVIDSGDHVNYTCTRVGSGSSVVVPAGTPYTVSVGDLLDGCFVWDAGTNGAAFYAQAEQDNLAIAAAVQKATSCWVVQTVLNGAAEPSGSANYVNKMLINNFLLTNPAFSGHVLDVRANLVASYNPANAADVIDHNNDVPPFSARAKDLSGTLTGTSGSTSTCAITFSNSSGTVAAGNVVTVESEMINISAGSNGAWTCTRGYAGTTAATHADGTAYVGVDSLHPGSPGSANLLAQTTCRNSNGYGCIGSQLATYLNGPLGSGPLLTMNAALAAFPTAANYQSQWPITQYTSTAGQAFVQNQTVYFGYNIPYNLRACSVGYRIVTADNTANIYDIGIYDPSGALLASTGALAGTSIMPSISYHEQALTTCVNLPAGLYAIAVTTNCAASCATIGNLSQQVPMTPYFSTSGGVTANGVLLNAIALPTKTWVVNEGAAQWWIGIHD